MIFKVHTYLKKNTGFEFIFIKYHIPHIVQNVNTSMKNV